MKKVVFLGIFTLFSFFLFSQSPQTIEVTDIDGFQYLSYQSINDSIWGIRYYSRDKNEVVHVCKVKGSGDIANYKKIEFELSSLLNTQIPKIKCGIRKIKIGFVFSNVLYDEIRIISSDYQINNIKKFKKKINKIINKMSIEESNCFTLFEIVIYVVGNCTLVIERVPLEYKNR